MEPGPTGDRAARNVQELRGNITFTDLASRLAALGRHLNAESLGKIEHHDPNKRRRMDVDDLVALALALDTTPNRLLLTQEADNTDVTLAPNATVKAVDAWHWATERPFWQVESQLNPKLFPLWEQLREVHARISQVAEEADMSWAEVCEAVRVSGHYVIVKNERPPDA